MSTDVSTTIKPEITEAFYLVMQVGIEAGIGPSVARERWIVTRAPKSDKFVVAYKQKPHGAPYLQDKLTRTLEIANHADEIVRLQKLLGELPTQYCGAPDMYGRNTSIVHVTDFLRLNELERYGSAAALGLVPPSEEQKGQFEEAVSIISKWSL